MWWHFSLYFYLSSQYMYLCNQNYKHTHICVCNWKFKLRISEGIHLKLLLSNIWQFMGKKNTRAVKDPTLLYLLWPKIYSKNFQERNILEFSIFYWLYFPSIPKAIISLEIWHFHFVDLKCKVKKRKCDFSYWSQ